MRSKTSQILLCFMVFLVCSAMIVGCKSMDTKTSTGITLKATKDVFIATATTAKRLCESGAINEADCHAIRDAYADGREMLIQAKALWDGMVAINDFAQNKQYEDMLIEISRMAAVIEGVIREYD